MSLFLFVTGMDEFVLGVTGMDEFVCMCDRNG